MQPFPLNELYFWTLSIVWCLKKLRTIRSIPTHHRQNPTEINPFHVFSIPLSAIIKKKWVGKFVLGNMRMVRY